MFAKRRSPHILEIRVHGVHNTPPAEMLETTPDKITRRSGDDLGSFWYRTDETPAEGIASVEAYSWGAQARTSGSALAVLSRVLVHLGWFLLLPYALANLAYWTRSIKAQESAGSNTWDGGHGAVAVRVFSLLLTLITVAAFCSVAIDMVAIQCYREAGKVCAALPEVFDGLVGLTRDGRAALLGIIPIAAIVVLYLIGRRGRVRFEAPVKQFGAGLGDTPREEGLPLLATRGFWSVARIGQTSEWLHVAASITLVLLVLALDAAYLQVPGCWRGSSTLSAACVTALFDQSLPGAFFVGSFLLLLVIVALVAFASHTPATGSRLLRMVNRTDVLDSPDARTNAKRIAAMVCLVLAAAGYTAWTILALARHTPQSDDAPGFLGLVVTPLTLIVLAFFVALAGVGWTARTTNARRAVSTIALVMGALAMFGTHWGTDADAADSADLYAWQGGRWWLIAIAAALIIVHLAVAASAPGDRRFVAWRGRGPAVAMMLALFAAMALSSLLVLGASSWLGRHSTPAPTDVIWRTPHAPLPREVWNVPDAYERFAVLLACVAGLLVILVLVVLARHLSRFVRFTLPDLDWSRPEDDTEGTAAERGGVSVPDPHDYPPALRHPRAEMRRRLAVRRSSQLMHRGEPLFGWLAAFAGIGFFSLSSSFLYTQVKTFAITFNLDPAAIRSTATAVLVAVAVAAAAAVATHAASSSERPLGVFWDVVAFFPRAGHPFAPPCFGERAVPELSSRTRAWLEEKSTPGPRAVIFTAHSMGSTICAATLLSLRGETIADSRGAEVLATDRMALLSYGSQLRAYFSRFFPSVFGPDVLGVPGVSAPSLWKRDPWQEQVLEEFSRTILPAPGQNDQRTLTALLGARGNAVPRWRNLWRRTDYLGFPVYAYRSHGNPVDRGVTEAVPDSYLWQLATHSNYLGTPQFLIARARLVRTLERSVR